MENFRLWLGRTLIQWAGKLMFPVSGDYLGSSEEVKGDTRVHWKIYNHKTYKGWTSK